MKAPHALKDAEKIEALADRIDHEELWRRPFMENDSLSPEQKDRRDAGVHLRRYASQRLAVAEELKKGAEYIRGYKLTREGFGTDSRGCGSHEWHGAINAFSQSSGYDAAKVMYLAKRAADEVPRMILLFESERQGKLPQAFKMCGHDPRPADPLPDNHLRCHLGVECRKCPYLLAIDAASMTPEAKDEAKAWTCATHIIAEKPNDYIEGFVDDKTAAAFDAHLVRSFAAEHESEFPVEGGARG